MDESDDVGNNEDRGVLAEVVRQFVADSKNFVATASECAASSSDSGDVSRSNAALRPITESVMRKLGVMAVACRRLTVASLTCRLQDPRLGLAVVNQLVENAIEVVSVVGDLLDAVRLIVESRSSAGRQFAVENMNRYAVNLARVLIAFVQRVRTV